MTLKFVRLWLIVMLVLGFLISPAYSARASSAVGDNIRATIADTVWPMSGTTAPDEINSPYGPRLKASNGFSYEFHPGLDFAALVGTPVHAIKNGTVKMLTDDAGCKITEANTTAPAGCASIYPNGGRIVQLDHGGLVYSNYLHLSAQTTGLKVGDAVLMASEIGLTGTTGTTVFPHLHFEIRAGGNTSGFTKNPLGYLPYSGDAATQITGSSYSANSVTVDVAAIPDDLNLNQVSMSILDAADNTVASSQAAFNEKINAGSNVATVNNVTLEPAEFAKTTAVYNLRVVFSNVSMAGGITYKVKATDVSGLASEYAAAMIAAPLLTLPNSGATLSSAAPAFTWEPVVNAQTYEIVFATDDVFTNVVHSNIVGGSAYTPVAPLADGNYFWRVRGRNATHYPGPWSAVRPFSVAIDAVAPVVDSFNATSPALGLTVPITSFSASDNIGVTGYVITTSQTPPASNAADWHSAAPATYNLGAVWTSPLYLYPWVKDAAGNVSALFGAPVSITITTSTRAPSSSAANDGWTLESKEFSNLASTMNNSEKLRAGDDALNRQYRSLLFFDTASIPNNAVIMKVIVKIYKSGAIGTDPFTTHGDLVADIKKGFFGLAPLQLTDFNAAAEPVNTAGRFRDIGSNWHQLTLGSLNYKYINVFGATQFRIRFVLDDNNNKTANIALFDSGGDANPPQLIIEYTAP